MRKIILFILLILLFVGSASATVSSSYINSSKTNTWTTSNISHNYTMVSDNNQVRANFNISYLTGLVAQWDLGQNTSTTVYNVNNASGIVNTTNQGTWHGYTSINSTAGKIGNATRFDGIDDNITVGHSESLNLSTHTIAAWVNASSAALEGYVVAKTPDGNVNTGYSLLWSGSTDTLRSVGGSAIAISNPVFTESNSWVHVAVVYSAGTATFYKNGQPAGSGATTITPTAATALTDVVIGNRLNGGATWFGGSIDEVYIWNRALSASEMAILYNASRTNYTNLTVYNETAPSHRVINSTRVIISNVGTNHTANLSVRINNTGTWTKLSDTLISGQWYDIPEALQSRYMDFNVSFDSNGSDSAILTKIEYNATTTNTSLVLVSPANGSTQSSRIANLQWREYPNSGSFTYQLSTDNQFINIISSGSGSDTGADGLWQSGNINLNYDTTYYWHVKNATSAYTNWSNFTILPFTPAPGRLNITALDEVNFTLITAFTVSLYNSSGAYLSKSTTTGWVNFTASDGVVEGDYLAIATGNTSYAERTLLMTSPGNYTFYLPSVSNTIDTVAFYLLDYTMKFPYLESNMTITRGSNITQSAGFDADAKQAANLIRGASYTITVANNNSGMIQQWGNYISTGSGNVQVVIMNLGVNQSVLNPYTQRINSSNTSIEMTWNDTASFLNSVNMTVYKDNTSTPVYNLVTSVKTGTATYLITDTNAVYITQMVANTTLGTHSDTNVMDLTSNTATITLWRYNTFTMPDWVKNAFGIVVLFMFAGSFGAMHRGEGAIITGIMAIFFYWWKILTQDSMIASMLGALLLFAILYHYASKSKPGGYF